MASQYARRAETVGTTSRFFRSLLLCSTLLLAAAASADPPEAEPDAAQPDLPIQDVGEVSITATRGERDPLEVAGNTSVIGREQIEASGARSIPELLRRQPGLFVTSTTSNPAGVQVEARGFNNGGALGSSLLVQVDGRRVNEADTGNTDWSLIPLDDIEAIEIVRGPASAIYGDNAVGGVINIRTLPAEGPLRASALARAGRHDTWSGSVRASGSVGDVTGRAFFSGFETDGYRDRSAFDDKHVDGSLEWNLGSTAVGAKAGYDDSFREFPGSLDPIERMGPRGRRGADPDSIGDESQVETWFAQAWLETFLAEDVQLRIEPHTNRRTDDVLISTSASGQFDIQTEKRAVGLDAQLRVDRPLFGHASRFITGFEFLYHDVESLTGSMFGDSAVDNQRQLYSGYVQEEFSVTEKLLLTGGVRIDRALYDIRLIDLADPMNPDVAKPRFTVWSPRASLNYAFLPCLSGYFSYGRGFRLPNFDEDAPFFGAVPNLDEQISDSLELGWKGRSDRVSASLAFYWMWVKDEILFDPENFTNANLDRVQHRGIEAAVDVRVLDWLSAYANYTLDDVQITREAAFFDGRRMPITPLHRGALGLTANLPCAIEANAHLNLVGSRRLANDFAGELPGLERYQTLDLFVAWRPKLTEHVSGLLSVGAYNVTGEKYDGFGALFEPSAFGFVPTRFVNPAAERTWQVSLGLTVTL